MTPIEKPHLEEIKELMKGLSYKDLETIEEIAQNKQMELLEKDTRKSDAEYAMNQRFGNISEILGTLSITKS